MRISSSSSSIGTRLHLRDERGMERRDESAASTD